MCIVTYLPASNGVFLTSNRDEHIVRAGVLQPRAYHQPGHINFYPADIELGATWFIVNDMGDCGIILNGATNKHQSNPPYKASRGKLLPAIFAFSEPLTGLKALDIADYEPFTIILYAGGQLYKCLWDGVELLIKKLDHTLPQIWCSVTLYDTEARVSKMKSFMAFLSCDKARDWAAIYQYHKAAVYQTNAATPNLQTLSVTSAAITAQGTELFYHDLITDEIHTKSIAVNTLNTPTCRY